MPPELAKQLDEQTELIIDDWVEQKHAHEVSKEVVCNVCDGSGYIKSNTVEYEGDCPACTDVSQDDEGEDE